MKVGVFNKSRKKASMSMRIRKADGTVIDLGKVSNIPVIGWFQHLMRERRINRYIKQQEATNG